MRVICRVVLSLQFELVSEKISMIIEISAILLLIILNGVLSMSEIAVVSSRKIRLQQRAETGSAGAKAALDLAENPNHFLSTVQIGITLIGILAGAFGGATVANKLEGLLRALPVPWLAASSRAVSVAIVVLIITYLSLILGELAPKQIALNDPEGIAAKMAPAMQRLSRLTAPGVHLLSASTRLVLHVAGVRPTPQPEVTEEEIKLLIEQGTEGGIFEPEEEEMVGQIFRLADRPIMAQMTPRTDMVWLDLEDPIETIKSTLAEARHSYFPVARGAVDNLLGVVQAKDLLAQCVEGKPINLEEKIIQPLILPESITILDALKKFQESRSQIAFIIDEFGGIQGLATITDILEAIAGDFPDAISTKGPEIVARDDGSYLIDGMLDIDEFKDLFDLTVLPGEEENYYQTLGGLVITFLGRIPSTGDQFEVQDLEIEIVDMDGLRVDKLLVKPKSGSGGVSRQL
jgi:putative hemolysin